MDCKRVTRSQREAPVPSTEERSALRFIVMREAKDSGRDILRDSEGYSYVVKETVGKSRYWRCMNRGICGVLVVENDRGFKPGRNTHNHPGNPELASEVTRDAPEPIKSARTSVMELCGQTEPISYTKALGRSALMKCEKIGEGVFGEVYRTQDKEGRSIAVKIIPIEGDLPVNDEPQKKFAEVIPEIVIAKELSNLRFSESNSTSSFCEVIKVSCIKGAYPAILLSTWDEFARKKASENDRPDKFERDQLYIVFQFLDCGTPLESFKFENTRQAKSIIEQVRYALTVAENACQFEHRDLHLGNILIRPTYIDKIKFCIGGKTLDILTHGVEANIIDYSLSRLTDKDGQTHFTDLSKDPTLFQGFGDHQFDIYRDMREVNGNEWKSYHPITNSFWIQYLKKKLKVK